MATPTDFAEANLLLVGPEGRDDIIPLPVRRTDDSVVSRWELSAEEVREIAETGVVWLSVIGRTAPPVYVTGCKREVI